LHTPFAKSKVRFAHTEQLILMRQEILGWKWHQL